MPVSDMEAEPNGATVVVNVSGWTPQLLRGFVFAISDYGVLLPWVFY